MKNKKMSAVDKSVEAFAAKPEVKLFFSFKKEVMSAYSGNTEHPNVKLAMGFFNHFDLPVMAKVFVEGGERKNPLKPEKFKLWLDEVKGTGYADDQAFAMTMESCFIDYEKLFNVMVKKERKLKAERDQFNSQSNAIQAAFRATLQI